MNFIDGDTQDDFISTNCTYLVTHTSISAYPIYPPMSHAKKKTLQSEIKIFQLPNIMKDKILTSDKGKNSRI
jgi:hypothetical protein